MAHRILIVGHGAAGLAAALAAAEEARALNVAVSITVIDCAPEGQHGGNTRWSPSYMRLAAPDRLAPGFEEDIIAASGGRADRAYVSRLAADATETIGWLERHGVMFHRPVYYLSAGPPRIQPVGGGASILQALTHASRKADVSFQYGCQAEQLIIAQQAIAGVQARDGKFTADAVVLACGGFEGNPEALSEHFGPGAETFRPISPGTRYNTGDGIRMARAAGALAAGDPAGMHAEPIDPRSTNSAPVVLVYPYGIVVDREGRRFFDEGGGLVHETWEHFARTIHFSAPGRIAFAILDAALLEIEGFERAIRSEVPPFEAGSIEALAALAGISPKGLAVTVAAYNAACGGDPSRFDATRTDGLKTTSALDPPKSNWARALCRPPFLCYPLVGAIAYTFGGIATDAEARVLGPNGPIAGLYAAGEITGHFHGTAPNAVAVLRALVFGRLAGRGAVRALVPRFRSS